MKYLLLILFFFLIPLAVPHSANAQDISPTIFYCVGDNPQPPCVTRTPSPSESPISSAPSTANPSTTVTNPATSTNPSPSSSISTAPSANPSPSISPCSTSQDFVHTQALHHGNKGKKHNSGNHMGLLQQFILLLLQLLQLIFKQLGINLPVPTGPCPTPSPIPSGAPSNSPTSGVSPSAAPSGASTAPSPSSPAGNNPTPTIFGVSPSPTTKPTAKPTTAPTSKATQTKNCVPNPHLCGFPDATNTGVPAGTKLTSSGSINVTTNGAVIDAKDVKGTIDVHASNVTIKRTRITTSSIYPIRLYSGSSNLTIEDVEVAGSAGCLRAEQPDGDKVTMIRMNVHGCEDGVQMGDDDTLTDSYIHDLSFTSGSHNDGIQQNGGSNDVVRHNTIFNPKNETSCVNFTTDFGSISNITIDNNLLDGGNYTVYSRKGSGGGSTPTGVKVTNNRFGRRYVYGLLSADGSVAWSGNVWDDTGATASQ